MRTTISIQDQLLEVVKSQAQKRNCTIGEVIEEALRQSLISQKPPTKVKQTPPITFKGRGGRPGVDLNDSAALLDAMGEA